MSAVLTDVLSPPATHSLFIGITMQPANFPAPLSSGYSISNTANRYRSNDNIKIQDQRLSLDTAYNTYGAAERGVRFDILKDNLPRHFLNFTTNKDTREHTDKDLVQWYIDMARGLRDDQLDSLNIELVRLLKMESYDPDLVVDITRVFSKVSGKEPVLDALAVNDTGVQQKAKDGCVVF